MLSIICTYNDRKIFDAWLCKNLRAQTARHEFIPVDNTSGRFTSAARAYNYGAGHAQADSTYLVFAHQDILLPSPHFLETAEDMLRGLQDLGVAGVAGKQEHDRRLFSNITHGPLREPAGVRIENPIEVMTVDECLAVVPRSVFERHQFDERVCDGWHCYMVEYCLRIRQAGLRAYVLPLEVYHRSTGVQDRAYFQSLKKVLAAHRKTHKIIYTTCGCWDTRTPVTVQRAWAVGKKIFYACTGRLIAWGLVPEWMQRKKRKRLRAMQKRRQQ